MSQRIGLLLWGCLACGLMVQATSAQDGAPATPRPAATSSNASGTAANAPPASGPNANGANANGPPGEGATPPRNDAQGGSSSAEAGETATSPGGAAAGTTGTGTTGDLRYLKGAEGQLVPVPDRAAYEEFLRWLDSRAAQAPAAVALSRLRLEGVAGEDRVTLSATIDCQVTVPDRWVYLPLGLTEAQLMGEPAYKGPGEHAPAPVHPERGMGWWFRGKGRHELVLPLQAPLRSKPPQRRLQLTVPPSPVSSLRLRVPAPRLQAKAGERTTLTTQPLGEQTELELVGLDERVDLVWQSLAPAAQGTPLLEVNTDVGLTVVEGEGISIEAVQRIAPLGQTTPLPRLLVRLPTGAELLRLQGPESAQAQPLPERPGWYAVTFQKPVAGSFELRYTLRAPAPPVDAEWVFEGFELESANAQTGHVAVAVVGDLRAQRERGEDKFLYRVNVSDLPATIRQPQLALGFRFFRRLRLPLRFERVPPLASVDPQSILLVREGLVELLSQQRLQIRRGSLARLKFRWPGWQAAGWSVPIVDLPGGAEIKLEPSETSPDELLLLADEPLVGNVTLRLRSQRPLADPSDRLETALPVCDVPVVHAGDVAIYAAENIEARLTAATGVALRTPANEFAESFADAPGLLRREARLVEPATGRLAVTIGRRNRRVQGHWGVQVEVADGVARVRQRLELDVEYVPLEELPLLLPEPLRRVPLNAELQQRRVATAPDRASGEWRLPLEPARTGRVVWQGEFALEFDPTAESVTIPLVQCAGVPAPGLAGSAESPSTATGANGDAGLTGAAIGATHLEVQDSSGLALAPLGAGWNRQLEPGGRPRWDFEGQSPFVQIALPPASVRRVVAPVDRALLRTLVEADGTTRTRAQYRLAPSLRDLPLRLAPGWRPIAIWWNADAVPLRPAPADAGRETLYRIVAPGNAPRATSVVTVEFENPTAELAGSGQQLDLAPPSLPGDRTPAETFWQLTVADDQYLFRRPAGFAPAYGWRWSGWGWLRQSMHGPRDLRDWLGEPAELPAWQPGVATHGYLLATTRPDLALHSEFIGRVPLVVLGAGGVLAIGLILSRWRFARSLPLLSLLAALAAFALVAHTETALLFLQPALLGGALLLFYGVIDRLVRRDAPPPPVLAPVPTGFASTIVAPPNPGAPRSRSGVASSRPVEAAAAASAAVEPRSSRP